LRTPLGVINLINRQCVVLVAGNCQTGSIRRVRRKSNCSNFAILSSTFWAVQDAEQDIRSINMKNPFTRRKPQDKGPAWIYTRGRGRRNGSNASRITSTSYTEDISPTLSYSWAVDPEEDSVNEKNTKSRGVGRLVQKLNCTSSSKKTILERDISMNQKRQLGGRKASEQQSTPTSAAREVVITVKSTISPGRVNASNPIRSRRRYAGEDIASELIDDFAGVCDPAYGKSYDQLGTRSYTSLKPPADARSSQKASASSLAARKERWLRGLQKGWVDDADQRDTMSGDDSTIFGCSPIASSGESIGTDYTTENSSDESEGYIRTRQHKHVLNSPSRRKGVSPAMGCNNGSIWTSVAEDMGIIAGILMSDGKACVGSVAEIAHETVMDTCRTQAPPTT